MKRSIAIILSCMFLLLCVLSPCLSVKASSQSFTTDYSSLLSVSQMEGVLSGLTASELSTLYTSLGGLAYSYLQSVNVDIKSSSHNSLLPDLGKQVLSFVFHPLDSIASYASGYVYDSLASNSKYFLSSLFKKVDDTTITENNYTSVTYDWKSVSSVMSDVFNSYNRVEGISFTGEEYYPISDSIFSSDFNIPFESYSLGSLSFENALNAYQDIHTSFPTSFMSYNNQTYFVNSPYIVTSSVSIPFDTILFLDNWNGLITGDFTILLPSGDNFTFTPADCFPFLFYNSADDSIAFVNKNSYFMFSPLDLLSNNFYTLSSSLYSIQKTPTYFSYDHAWQYFSNNYNFNDFAAYFLSLTNVRPSFLPSNYKAPQLSNVHALSYFLDYNVRTFDLSVFKPFSLDPISIDPNNVYQGSLQLPVDNSPGAVANLDIQSVIDAINDNSLVNNVDRLGSIISDGVVGSIPQVSIDAWNPDKVTEHATSTDISVGLDGLSAIEGTYVDNVAPVFETYPIVPFLQPIFESLGSNVISIIAVCIFIVVLFGFLNKLLF